MEEPRFGLPKVSPKITAPEDALKEIIKLNPGGMIVEDLLECMCYLGYGRTKSKEVLKQQVENGVFKKIDHATDSRCKIVLPNEIDDQLSNPNLIAIKWRDDKVIVRGKFQYVTKHYEGYNSSSTSESIYHHFRDDINEIGQNFRFFPLTDGLEIIDIEYLHSRFNYRIKIPPGKFHYKIEFIYPRRSFYQVCFTKNLPELYTSEIVLDFPPTKKPILIAIPENKKIGKLIRLSKIRYRLKLKPERRDYQIAWKSSR